MDLNSHNPDRRDFVLPYMDHDQAKIDKAPSLVDRIRDDLWHDIGRLLAWFSNRAERRRLEDDLRALDPDNH